MPIAFRRLAASPRDVIFRRGDDRVGSFVGIESAPAVADRSANADELRARALHPLFGEEALADLQVISSFSGSQ